MPYINKNVKSSSIGYDYDGVVSDGIMPKKGSVIITGRPESGEDEIREGLETQVPIHFFDGHDELTDENKNIKIGAFKAAKIKELGIEKFYESEDDQVTLLKELTKAEIVKVTDGIAEEPMKFICFTCDGMILPVAQKLIDEGNTVVVGMVENTKNTFTDEQLENGSWKPEDPEKKAMRWALGDMNKHSAESLLKEMKSLKDKEDWFILADSNCMFRFCQEAYEMGFTNGFFPTEEDRDFEENRTKGKEFVKEHYEGIEIGEVHEFTDVESAKEFLGSTDKMWALKSQGDLGDTIIPISKELESATSEILSALETHGAEYENDGFILEEFLPDVIELTPQVIFYNGVPAYYSLDIENKPIGAGNIGTQVGCAQNLIIRTERDDMINKIAFPEIVYEMAKEHKGMFVWDCSILISNGKMYFGEFCSNRFGWDAFPTELSMCQSYTLYFKKVMAGKDPLNEQFGVGIRVFNLGANGEVMKCDVCVSDPKYVYLYDVADGKAVGGKWDLGVVTGCGDDVYDAVNEAYENLEKVTLESKYVRPKFDFLSYDYTSSIMNRRSHALMNGLINENHDNETKSEAPYAGVKSP